MCLAGKRVCSSVKKKICHGVKLSKTFLCVFRKEKGHQALITKFSPFAWPPQGESVVVAEYSENIGKFNASLKEVFKGRNKKASKRLQNKEEDASAACALRGTTFLYNWELVIQKLTFVSAIGLGMKHLRCWRCLHQISGGRVTLS